MGKAICWVSAGALLLLGACGDLWDGYQRHNDAVCGNGQCEAGEDTDRCCLDCGCGADQICACARGAACPQAQAAQGGPTCRPAPRCGDGTCDPNESQQTCCQDCACPADLACRGATCSPVCGNGKCQAGEDSMTCCQDCGCSNGGACMPMNWSSWSSCISFMKWWVQDACKDNISLRIFDASAQLTWPSSTLVWSLESGKTYSADIGCVTGHSVCYGARRPNGYYWGVDIDNSQSCNGKCCVVCTDGPVGSQTDPIKLTCSN